MNRIQTLTASDWGPSLHRAARVAGTVAALLITTALVAGECAYGLGRQLRLAIEARNDQLATWWVGVLGLRQPVATTAPAAEAPVQPPAALLLLPAAAPLLMLAPAEPATVKAARTPRKRKATAGAKPAPRPAAAPRKATRRKAAAA
jgi:hypothetical protein